MLLFSFSVIIIFIYSNTGVLGLEEKCVTNEDCPTVNSICTDLSCGCDAFSYFSSNTNSCLTYVTEYKAFCVETKQCAFLGDNASCTENYCMCEKNYRWYQGMCRRYIEKGGACTSKYDCFDGYDPLALDCLDNVCSCSDEYYDRGGDCRRAGGLGNSCAINYDCQKINTNWTCKRGYCEKDDTEFMNLFDTDTNIESEAKLLTNRLELFVTDSNDTITCEYDDECKNMLNSECVEGVCRCKSDHYTNGNNCLPGMNACEIDSDCPINNTICFLGVSCICKQGYFLSDGECIPEVGLPINMEANDTNVECKIQGSRLVDQACHCIDNWFVGVTNRECIKTSTEQFPTCLSNEWCNVMGPNSYCEFTTGNTGNCKCSSFAELDETTYYCKNISDKPDDLCLRNSDCSYNQVCRNERCECVEKFVEDEFGNCMPVIEGSCEDRSCSVIDNAKCSGGYCKCSADSIFNDTTCLKKADKLNDHCDMDVQCVNLNYTICDGKTNNKTCVCDSGYVEIGEICMKDKEYGSPCMTLADCILVLNRSFQCRNSICQCPVNYTLRNGYCSSATKLVSEIIVFIVFFTILWNR